MPAGAGGGFMKKIILLFCCMSICFSGCAFISIPLSSSTRPLKETRLEGSGKERILIIDVSGIISSAARDSLIGLDNETQSPVARIKEELDKAAGDERVKAVILRINSPGGTVTACDTIYREILEFKKRTHVFVAACLMDLAASGGYYIACAADQIVAHPTTVTGSIGVISMKFNFKGLLEKIGIQDQSIMSGDKKDMFSYWRDMTDEEKKIMQDVIDSMYQQFVACIDEGRKSLNTDDILPLADGRIYTAQQALDHELIDRIGYLDDTIQLAKKAAGLEEASVISYHRPREYRNNIYSQANISILGLGNTDIVGQLPVQFMYMWYP